MPANDPFAYPEVRQALLQMFSQQPQQMQMPQPAVAPQVVHPDLGPVQQQGPMGMNPMLGRLMQRFAQPGGMRAAAAPAVPNDVALGLTGGGYGGGGIGSR